MATTTKIQDLRILIYRRAGVAHYSKSYRPRKLRKVCVDARGLDLRRADHVILLAQRLGILPTANNVVHVDFLKAA